MLTTSENPEPVYDDYIDIEYYNYIDNPINGSEVDSIYINPSFYNGRVVNTWNYGNSNTEMIKFKFVEGCGEASYYKSYWLENDYFEKNDELIYFKKGDEEWGTPQYILSKSFTDPLAQWNVAKTYPNANPQNPNFVETTTKTYGFDGDTIIGNQTWLKFYSSPDSAFSNELFYEGCLLDDNGIVKFRDNENTIDTIYNFSLSAGDSVLYNFDYGSSYMKIESIDSVEINEQYFKRFIFEENIDYPPFFLSEVWIEGIGSIHGPLFPKYPKLFSDEIPDSLNLTCYKIDNSIMWNNPFYDVCYVNIILSIKELSKNRIYIFPNPARDLIQFTNPYNQTFSYKISSINGQLVKSESRNENNQIDISELNPGIYILKIYQTDKYFYKKLIKE